MLLENSSRIDTNLQVSNLINVSGNYESETPFLIKNISGEDIVLSVKMASSDDIIETVFQPGWNPENIKGVYNVESDLVQIGW